MNELIENKKKHEILAEKISKMNYGDVILHTEISSVINEPYPSSRYTSFIHKTKSILLNKYGRVIESVHGDGYRVLEPDNYTDNSLCHVKRGFRELQKGSAVLKHAPINDMSDEARNVYRRVNDRMILLNASMKGSVAELRELGKKDHPFLPEHIRSGRN